MYKGGSELPYPRVRAASRPHRRVLTPYHPLDSRYHGCPQDLQPAGTWHTLYPSHPLPALLLCTTTISPRTVSLAGYVRITKMEISLRNKSEGLRVFYTLWLFLTSFQRKYTSANLIEKTYWTLGRNEKKYL